MTHLSSQDSEIYTKVFLEVDENGDGYLNIKEVGRLCDCLGFRFNPGQVQEMFQKLDTDGNEKVTLDEFLVIMDPLDSRERACAHLRKLFNETDTNKDGFLSAEELQVTLNRATAEAGVTLTKNQVQELMSKVDLDGDGRMNFEEFLILLAALSM